ncbi:hypothetical protein [Pelosinus baikalensis]|uniref:Uncharacterized protein n=1 Tax=Pelosinus baikalensis TaxID=2892015 RepID=A0ABS8HWH4_9FIRM|nr:hypothetical protein [Pelosinus baikalensis]MCC5467509.1 hypothetical protein [Pelosinus baikalensis]
MAKTLEANPNLFLKLAATSMGLTMATAKLYSYCSHIIKEAKADLEFMNELEQAYASAVDEDTYFAEKFVKISAEADKITLEIEKCHVC